MKDRANQQIRLLCKNNNVMLWQIADKIGVADTTLSKRLRRELSEGEKQHIIAVINEIRSESGGQPNAE